MTGIIVPDGGTIGSASDTDAISIASDGQVTIAQNNPTITLGSNATFPSGHIIKTESNTAVSTSHETSSSSTAETSSYLSDSITTTVANSKILIMYSSFGSHTQTGTKGNVWLQQTINSSSTQLQQGKMVYLWGNYSHNHGGNYSPLHLIYVDEPNQLEGTAITYTARFNRGGGANTFYFIHNNYVYQTILMEIAP